MISDLLFYHATDCIRVPVNISDTYDDQYENVEDSETARTQNADEAELSDRYRRLIPYMTYYVLNNYINNQQSPPQPIGPTESSVLRARPQLPPLQPLPRPQHPVSRPLFINKSRYKEDRFIPSVQYNPRQLGPESDFFVPVTYSSVKNVHYKDYDGLPMTSPKPQPTGYVFRNTIITKSVD